MSTLTEEPQPPAVPEAPDQAGEPSPLDPATEAELSRPLEPWENEKLNQSSLDPALEAALSRLQGAVRSDAEVDEFRAQERRDRVAALRRRAQMPRRQADFCRRQEDRSEGADWWSEATDWGACCSRVMAVVDAGGVVALAGPQGSGKTTMGVAVARKVTDRLESAVWAHLIDFMNAISDAKINGRLVAELREWVDPWLLVLDQADKVPVAEWENRQVFRMLDARYEASKPTVLLLNVESQDPGNWLGELAEKLGASVIDRIRETGSVELATWKSVRPTAGQVEGAQ